MDALTPEKQLTMQVQFQHLERRLAGMPGVTPEVCAAILGTDVETLASLQAGFAANARRAAAELLEEPGIAECVDHLPFTAGGTVVGLGDSITDDGQSWLEILRHLLALRRPADGIQVVNCGISGDTTSQMLARVTFDLPARRPEWVICLAGTNDARLHGSPAPKTLVSLAETAANLDALHRLAQAHTRARWLWLTPPPVDEEKVAAFWGVPGVWMTWRNRDLAAIGEAIRRRGELFVDLPPLFGDDPALLLEDGLHPSLAGQKVIARAVVQTLSGCEGA